MDLTIYIQNVVVVPVEATIAVSVAASAAVFEPLRRKLADLAADLKKTPMSRF